jgi:hypothetical protein
VTGGRCGSLNVGPLKGYAMAWLQACAFQLLDSNRHVLTSLAIHSLDAFSEIYSKYFCSPGYSPAVRACHTYCCMHIVIVCIQMFIPSMVRLTSLECSRITEK